jgi:chromosome segregation ATPase
MASSSSSASTSYRYVSELGITRLKELAKILQIPGYSTYTDPLLLRNHIVSFLNSDFQIRESHLKRIQKSRIALAEATKHLYALASQRSAVRRSPKKGEKEEKTVQVCDSKVREVIQKVKSVHRELTECKAQAGVQGAEPQLERVIKALKEYLKVSNLNEIENSVKSLSEMNQKAQEGERKCLFQLESEKKHAVENLEKAERLSKELQKKTQELQTMMKQASTLSGADSASVMRNLESQISKQVSRITELQDNLTQKNKELDESKMIIESLQMVSTGQPPSGGENFDTRVQQLTTELDWGRTRIAELEAALSESAKKHAQCEATLSARIAEVSANVAGDVERCNQRADTILASMKDFDRLIAEGESKVSLLRQQIAEMKGKPWLNAEANSLLQQVSNIRGQLREYYADRKGLEQTEHALRSTCATVMNNDLNAKQKSELVTKVLEKCEQGTATFLQNSRELNQQLRKCDQQWQECEGKNKLLEQEYENLRADRDSLQERVTKCDAEVVRLIGSEQALKKYRGGAGKAPSEKDYERVYLQDAERIERENKVQRQIELDQQYEQKYRGADVGPVLRRDIKRQARRGELRKLVEELDFNRGIERSEYEREREIDQMENDPYYSFQYGAEDNQPDPVEPKKGLLGLGGWLGGLL